VDLNKLSEPLSIDQIDFRVQSINKGGYCTILAYKDARVDMMRLNEVCGPLGWKREHVNGNANCIVSIWCEDKKEWVSKEDTGTESNTESAKGLASDSFKRANFNWGIGIELYDYPIIQLKLNEDEWEMKEWKGKQQPKATWNLKLRDWTWHTQFTDGKLSYLAAKYNDKLRFEWDTFIVDTKPMDDLRPTATYIIHAINKDDKSAVYEAWKELSEEEQKLMWTAVSKGGFFSMKEKEYIRASST